MNTQVDFNRKRKFSLDRIIPKDKKETNKQKKILSLEQMLQIFVCLFYMEAFIQIQAKLLALKSSQAFVLTYTYLLHML